MEVQTYKPIYEDHWALVVGINNYAHAGPLSYACNDARVFAERLTTKFGFPTGNVVTLLDGEATLSRIQAEMARLHRETGPDDRVAVFYAGHGHTVSVNGRDFGFLVPVDGSADDTSTLLPWEDLVNKSQMIRAKHMLFVMDACYSGLMAMRGLPPGSTRFARDMMGRYSRQVLAAGKGNQVVADSGGPRHGHSMFTGHLLDALDGFMSTTDGLIHAESVMSYVYDKVAKDPRSEQSPHRTQFAGQGNFFFTDPKIDLSTIDKADKGPVQIEVPADLIAPEELLTAPPLRQQLEEYLSERKDRIRLHNLVSRELRVAQQRLGVADFSVQGSGITANDFTTRLKRYEEAVADLLTVSILLGRWADSDQQAEIQQIVHVLAGEIEPQGGVVLWLALRSYPMLLAMYAGGIAALEGSNYQSLRTLFTTPVAKNRRGEPSTVLQATVDAMLDVNRTDAFKLIPEFERKHTPLSEYMFMRMQPILEDHLMLGSRYEQLFDRFEIFYALCYADLADRGWGHPGRFGWKYVEPGYAGDPFNQLVEEAKRDGDSWPPLRAGLFRGSLDRFLEVAKRFEDGLLKKLNWF